MVSAAGLALMYAATGVRVTRFVHNEAQFGKTELDGLFGICTQAVTRFIDGGHDVTTSAELVRALIAAGPRNNVIRGLDTKNEAWHLALFKDSVNSSRIPGIKAIREIEYTALGLKCFDHSYVSTGRLVPWMNIGMLPGWAELRQVRGPPPPTVMATLHAHGNAPSVGHVDLVDRGSHPDANADVDMVGDGRGDVVDEVGSGDEDDDDDDDAHGLPYDPQADAVVVAAMLRPGANEELSFTRVKEVSCSNTEHFRGASGPARQRVQHEVLAQAAAGLFACVRCGATYTTKHWLTKHMQKDCTRCTRCLLWFGSPEAAQEHEDRQVCAPRKHAALGMSASDHGVKVIIDGQLVAMATAKDKRTKRAATRQERYEARQAAGTTLRRDSGWAVGKIGADYVHEDVKQLLITLFAEGDTSNRRKWSGEEALEYLRMKRDEHGKRCFPYHMMPSLLGIKSVFSRGKALMKARAGGASASTRRRWTAAEDEAVRTQLLAGAAAREVRVEGRAVAAIVNRVAKLRKQLREEGVLPVPRPRARVMAPASGVPVTAAVGAAASRHDEPSVAHGQLIGVQVAGGASQGDGGVDAHVAASQPVVPGRRRRWTTDEDDSLRQQLLDGVKTRDLKLAGRARSSIVARVARLRKELRRHGV